MEWLKYVLCLAVGIIFWGLGKLLGGPAPRYTLGEEKQAVVTGLSVGSNGTKFNLRYEENGREVRMRTITYRQPKRFSPGDRVIIRVAEYESGAKLAMISDAMLVPAGGESRGGAKKLLTCIGGILVLLAVGLLVVDLVK